MSTLFSPYKFPMGNIEGLTIALGEKQTKALSSAITIGGVEQTTVEGALNALAEGGGIADISAIAPTFSEATSYAVDDAVTYEGKLYICTTAHTGAWNANDFRETTVDEEKANQAELGNAFSTFTAYAIGDVVTDNGKLYRFTSPHPAGAWNSSHVTEINVGDQIANYKEVNVTVPSSAWSSTTTGGFYTATVTTPAFSTALPPKVAIGSNPTMAEMAAYRNVQLPNGYIEQLSSTSLKLYALTKPTDSFRLRLTGYGIGVQIDSCQSAINAVSANTAEKTQRDLEIESYYEGGGLSSTSFNGNADVTMQFIRSRKLVLASSWSSTANANGYYTAYVDADANIGILGCNIYCVGVNGNTNPTAEQMAAYRNICLPNGYVTYTAQDSRLVLYAKTKPTIDFYVMIEGVNIR